MKKIYLIIILVIILAGGLFLLNNFHPAGEQSSFKIVASFYPLYFFTQQIAGDKANVINITPVGVEPHDYELTAKDIIQIENSKMIVLNGGGLEAWGENIKKNINMQKTVIVVAGEGLANQQIVENGGKIIDPHIWQSPVLAKLMVDKIAQGFFQIDPANKNYYQINANALKSELNDLNEQYRAGLANCAEKNIITSHAAFGYLAAAYGLNQVSIAGLSPDAEPSIQQLAEISKFAKTNNIKYIFFETLVSPKLSNTIASEIGAKILVLNPIEGLSNEELAQGKNYFTEMQSNLANLRIALQCK